MGKWTQKSVLMLGIAGPDRSFAFFSKAAMLERDP